MTYLSVEDALKRLENYKETENVDDLAQVEDFLNSLEVRTHTKMCIATDQEGYIIEGAMQRGFDMIDDDGGLFVVHGNDLIKFVADHRRINKAANALRLFVSQLKEIGFEDDDEINGGDMVEFLGEQYPTLKAALS